MFASLAHVWAELTEKNIYIVFIINNKIFKQKLLLMRNKQTGISVFHSAKVLQNVSCSQPYAVVHACITAASLNRFLPRLRVCRVLVLYEQEQVVFLNGSTSSFPFSFRSRRVATGQTSWDLRLTPLFYKRREVQFYFGDKREREREYKRWVEFARRHQLF